MFGLDFAVDGVLDQFCDWIYGKLITFFGEFFSMINMMGAELFELDWIKAILLFFYYFAWALYIVGIVVAVFDTAIDARRGKGSFQDLALNIIKGFFAVSLFTVVPIDLYVFCINLSNELIGAIAGMSDSPGKLGAIATMVLGSFETPGANVVVSIVFVILIGYAVIKVFFCKLKTRRYPSCHDGNWQSLSVQCTKRIQRRIRVLVQTGSCSLPDSVFTDHCTGCRASYL